MERFSYKVGVLDVEVCVLSMSYLKEELACAADKQLWVISTIKCYLKNSYNTKELKGTKE